MNYAERLQNVTVLGAAGKMGSGILLLTAIEMADISFLPENKDKFLFLLGKSMNRFVIGCLRPRASQKFKPH